jgi:DNA-binding LacI/PurR family transcriptional regulator
MDRIMQNLKRVTIKEVARKAGVSAQTVSRVMNERPDVAPETRDRVQSIIQELGYQPSALARSLIQQRSFTLGVVTAGLKYIGPSRTLNGITQQAEELGYALMLKELPSFIIGNILPILQSLLSRHVDGIIWAAPEVGESHRDIAARVAEIPVPVVLLTTRPQPGLVVIHYDNYHGGQLAAQHLLAQGYRRIGHISGPLDWWEARQRKQGWEAAMAEAGLPTSEAHWAEGNWSSASGEQAFRQLLDSYPDIEAVFAGNDQMALAALQLACREGLHVPEKLGVVGFDGLPESRFYWPPLTTVLQDQNLLGCTAVEKVVEMIEAHRGAREIVEPQAIVLQPEMIIRQSSVVQNGARQA